MEQKHILENGEIVLEKVRKHWIVYVKDALMHVGACFVVMILAVYITKNGTLSFIDRDMVSYIGLILMMLVIIFWVSFFYAWTKNYFDVWYVTDKHVIAINQKQILEREEMYMELSRIQDVSFEKSGFLSTWLGFGRLKIQSAGIDQEFVMDTVHDVESFAYMIMKLRDETQGKNNSDMVTKI
ncbi:MAG: PH domain-containing protein [Candidatus Pacebacteria bacterium]|nr:PH domain-containing protein [Candidatus Paceibacterota bacterium]MBP9867238.1 PH domain-containing protein [Candidatus Paceibacterota bacterium]